jgi:hypothetical protein
MSTFLEHDGTFRKHGDVPVPAALILRSCRLMSGEQQLFSTYTVDVWLPGKQLLQYYPAVVSLPGMQLPFST